MESANVKSLQAFAAEFPDLPLGELWLAAPYQNNFINERTSLYQLGESLGYFDPEFVSRVLLNAGQQVFAPLSEASDRPTSRANSATISFFQAALHLANGFNQPLVVLLQRTLQDEESFLDDGEIVCSSPELWAVLRDKPPVKDQDWSLNQTHRCQIVAGFIELTKLLGAFDALFEETFIEVDWLEPSTIERISIVSKISGISVGGK